MEYELLILQEIIKLTEMTIPDYKNPGLSPEERADDLLARMTLDEKIAQVTGAWNTAKQFLDESREFVPAKASELFPNGIGQLGRILDGLDAYEMARRYNEIQKHFVEHTRLGIPVLFHEECLHGVMEQDAVSFAHPIAMAGSFAPELVEQVFAYAARDARARGARQALTPVLDVCRDPRWGRTEETYGEDPYLVGQMGLAAVRGLQGRGQYLANDKVIATLKHFAAHGQPEDGTNAAPANYSERIIREVFLSPFKSAIADGRAMSVMASYNEIDGVPSHASQWLLGSVLRGEWAFEGTVVSDYYGIEQLEERHHIADNKNDTARLALLAGVDIELPEANIYASLRELAAEELLCAQKLDESVRRLLRYKFIAGLFDAPYVCPETAQRVASDPAAKQLSYAMAAESICLLKNAGSLLPLDKDTYRTVAVIGPNADYHSIGGYSMPNQNFVTIRRGIEDALAGQATVIYRKGCGITTPEGSWFVDAVERTDEAEDRLLIEDACRAAAEADIIVLCIGGNEQTSREAWKETHLGDRPTLQMAGLQNELYDKLLALGKPIVAVLSHGRPLEIGHICETAGAVLDCWYLGQETGRAVADALLGRINPSGKLAISYPRSAGHIPVFYNHKPNARRGYLFDAISPLFAFGYGLSYTKFELSGISLSADRMRKDDLSFTVNGQLTNTGSCCGSEVVQVYIRDLVSSVTRPVKELKGFRKIRLDAGCSAQFSIEIGREALMFYDIAMEFVAEAGMFAVMVGTSSRAEDLQTVYLTLEG